MTYCITSIAYNEHFRYSTNDIITADSSRQALLIILDKYHRLGLLLVNQRIAEL